MIGARAADRVLAIGGDEPDLIAEVARVTGLNGEVVVAAPAETHPAFEAAAARAGSLLVLEAWDGGPLPGASPFDVCVWLRPLGTGDPDVRRARIVALTEALRPGGRVVLAGPGRPGSGGAPPADEGLLALLREAGHVAVRHLATEGRTAWYEARLPR